MSEVIVITSGKGGVGKTTTTANVGCGLAMLNKKVVMIDTDIGLRNLDVVLGLENRIVYNLVDVVEGKCRLKQAMIKHKKYPELCLIPSAQTRDKDSVTPEQMKELEILQREILSIVWRYVKPGGRLVYSTCTVNPGENQENAKWFADSFPFEPMDLRGKLGPEFEEESLKKGWIQLMPGIHPGDGFFISAFRRRPEPLRKA